MKIISIIVVLVSAMLVQACDRGAVMRRENDVRKQIVNISPKLLENLPIGELKLPSEPVMLVDVPVQRGVIGVPAPIERTEGKNSTKLVFEEFALYVYRASGGTDFDSLPSSWGGDDLEKMISVAKTSGSNLEAATSEKEVEDVAYRIKSKEVICPSGMNVRADVVETDNYLGFMAGDKRLTLFLRPKDVRGVCFRVEIRPEPEKFTEDDLRWILSAIKVRVAE